jgi:FkbH-like protein
VSDESVSTFLAHLSPRSDLTFAHRLARRLKGLPSAAADRWTRRTVKLAILCGATTAHLVPVLELFFAARRMKLEVWTSGYDFEAELASRPQALANFAPDLVLLSPVFGDIRGWPNPGCSIEEERECLEGETRRWCALRDTIHEWLNAVVLQDGFVLPLVRRAGEFESNGVGGTVRFVRALNDALSRDLPAHVLFQDLDFEAGRVGRSVWHDRNYWLSAKYAISPAAAAAYSCGVSAIAASHFGLSKKCVAVDLDNTLWGGVVGDDGPEGLVLGEGSAAGEAFKAFQTYLKDLKRQGVLLAVCSKNEESNAREPFRVLRDTVLVEKDFDVFVANWKSKSENLATIAERLNIGIDSIVFFDDNPAEREEVRRRQPDVWVVEAPDDPSGYVDALDELRLFETHRLSAEDLARGDLYRRERDREALAGQSQDYDSYLRDLGMVASISPFTAVDMVRITQLINKTNQFNLTTRRTSEVECKALVGDRSVFTRTMRLSDRFGDHGLISAMIGRFSADGAAMEIETWVMSCRVFKRGAENALFATVCEDLRAAGVARIFGRFLQTAKNGVVATLYRDLRFTLVEQSPEGNSLWNFELSSTQPPAHFISVERTASS